MLQRGLVLMQTRGGLLQPVRLDPKKQKELATAAAKAPQLSRAAPLRRMAEQQPIGDTGQQRRGPPPAHELAAKRQMQKELQEAQRSEMGGAGRTVRPRGGQPRPVLVPAGHLPPEMARLPPGHEALPFPLTVPPHLHGGYFFPGSAKHFSSKSNEPPKNVRQGAAGPQGPRRAVGALGHLVSPVRVSSGPTSVSPRELHLSSPRTYAHSSPGTPRGFAEDNTSPRLSSDAEKTPRSPAGRQDGGWKASPRLSAEGQAANSPRGDTPAASQRTRGIPKDRGDEKLLRNLNLKVTETKGGRIPDKGKFPTNTGAPSSELNKTMNEVRGRSNAGEMEHRNPYLAGGGAIYQMERKTQFGRGGGVGPLHRDPQGAGLELYGAKPMPFHGHGIPGLQQQQMPMMPMASPKLNLNRGAKDTSRMASQKKPPTVVAKKTTNSPLKSPASFSPTLLIGTPAASPMNSPRPSMMMTHNAPSKNTGRVTNAAKASPGGSPARVPKSPSPRNSPTGTYVITPKHSPTALSVPLRKTTAKSPQANAIANVSTKLQIDSSVSPTKSSITKGKDRKGKYENPKSRLSAGGDLQSAKERLKTDPYKVGAGEAVSPPAEKLGVAATAQTQPSREAEESRLQPKELSDLNKEEKIAKTSPRIRRMMRNSLLPVLNPSTPKSAISDQPPEEEQGKSGNTTGKQPEGTPRKGNAAEGNKKLPPAAKNRKGAATGAVHPEGAREAPRGKAAGAAARHRRGRGAGARDSLDVAAALPDTSGNFTSAVHQWLRQSHYKVISPQQYRQHETIQEETAKQTGTTEKMMAFRDERAKKEATPEPEKAQKAPPPPPAEKGGRKGRAAATRCEDVPRSLSPLSERYQPTADAARPLRKAPLSLLMKQKDMTAMPKPAAAAPAGRGGKKPSKGTTAAAAAAAVAAATATKRGTAKGRGARRKEDKGKGKLPPSACPRLRPKVGPAGDSGDLSSSSEDSSFLSASDDEMNEQSAMC